MNQSDIEIIGKEIGQINVVIRCVIRALIQTPNFDSITFINLLSKEESMCKDSESAKDTIKMIIAEAEGHL